MIICAVGWGFMGIFTRRLSDEGFGAMEVSFLRMLTSVVILIAAMAILDRDGLKIKKKDLWLFMFFGVFKMLSDYFLFVAQIRIQLSLSTVLQLLVPYWVMLLSYIAFREKVTRRNLVGALVAFIGVVLATGILEQGLTLDVYGVIFGILSGFTFAFYAIGNKVLLERGYQPLTALAYILLFATVFCIPFVDLGQTFVKIDCSAVVKDIIFIGPLLTLIPYYLQTYSTKILSPTTVMLIALLEVFVATQVGYLYFHETLTNLMLLGLILIPLSIIFMSVNIRKVVNRFTELIK